jgi:glutamate racemase
MPEYDLLFCDSCLGGSTVTTQIIGRECGVRAFYLADYAVNPLGRKAPCEIERAVRRWIEFAASQTDTVVVACNTASISLHETGRWSTASAPHTVRLVSMLDLFDRALVSARSRLEGASVCLMGTEYTVRHPVYHRRLLTAGAAAVRPLAASRTENVIARLQHTSKQGQRAIAHEIGDAIRSSDVVVLACTCFPLISRFISDLNPACAVIDPAAGAVLHEYTRSGRMNRLTVGVTGGESLTAADSISVLFPGWHIEDVIAFELDRSHGSADSRPHRFTST